MTQISRPSCVVSVCRAAIVYHSLPVRVGDSPTARDRRALVTSCRSDLVTTTAVTSECHFRTTGCRRHWQAADHFRPDFRSAWNPIRHLWSRLRLFFRRRCEDRRRRQLRRFIAELSSKLWGLRRCTVTSTHQRATETRLYATRSPSRTPTTRRRLRQLRCLVLSSRSTRGSGRR